jgi:hypothetical protein
VSLAKNQRSRATKSEKKCTCGETIFELWHRIFSQGGVCASGNEGNYVIDCLRRFFPLIVIERSRESQWNDFPSSNLLNQGDHFSDFTHWPSLKSTWATVELSPIFFTDFTIRLTSDTVLSTSHIYSIIQPTVFYLPTHHAIPPNRFRITSWPRDSQ